MARHKTCCDVAKYNYMTHLNLQERQSAKLSKVRIQNYQHLKERQYEVHCYQNSKHKPARYPRNDNSKVQPGPREMISTSKLARDHRANAFRIKLALWNHPIALQSNIPIISLEWHHIELGEHRCNALEHH